MAPAAASVPPPAGPPTAAEYLARTPVTCGCLPPGTGGAPSPRSSPPSRRPARHRVAPPRLGVDSDAARRAAALLQTLVLLRPLPAYDVRLSCAVVIACMHASGEGLDVPCGELVELTREFLELKSDVHAAADRIRAWRVRPTHTPRGRAAARPLAAARSSHCFSVRLLSTASQYFFGRYASYSSLPRPYLRTLRSVP